MQKFSQKSESCKVHLNRRARCVWRCIYRKFSLIGRFVSVWGGGKSRKFSPSALSKRSQNHPNHTFFNNILEKAPKP